jgi:hypothetical protein
MIPACRGGKTKAKLAGKRKFSYKIDQNKTKQKTAI